MNDGRSEPPVQYEAALRLLMADPAHQGLMFDSYIEDDPASAARRFEGSAEWAAVLGVLGTRIAGATVLDLGAGNGIASVAFAQAGAKTILAVEPNAGVLAGRAAIHKLEHPEIVVVDAMGEALPFDDASVDVVYGRQVLHHARDLAALLRECARVLRPGGLAMFTREHVADDEAQLAAFLDSHPVHQLAGGENAYPLDRYRTAITEAPLRLVEILGPWDSIINAFPTARSEQELQALIKDRYERRFGRVGRALAYLPGASEVVRRRQRGRDPGRLFSFVSLKPR